MKITKFSKVITKYFSRHLPGIRNLSSNTIASYRDAFKLLLIFYKEEKGISPEKLDFDDFVADAIYEFLNWLENKRSSSISTRNQRLAALHAFCRYAQTENPEYMLPLQKILQIPAKKYHHEIIQHLSPEQMRVMLQQPGITTSKGRRNTTLLSVPYDTGARVQELCDIQVKDVRLSSPATITLTGKGKKTRVVPIMGNTVGLLDSYIKEHKLKGNGSMESPLFFNQRKIKLTRGGVNYILQKYAKQASTIINISNKTTPHILRHSKAMHLYQAGVDLIYIRDILGHVDISTTDIYARADVEAKRKALENTYNDIPKPLLSDWSDDEGLMDFLNSL